MQEMLVRRGKDRLVPQRYAGGHVLTELLRCACGSPMVGTSNRSYRYYGAERTYVRALVGACPFPIPIVSARKPRSSDTRFAYRSGACMASRCGGSDGQRGLDVR
jgi:hypothetical protein